MNTSEIYSITKQYHEKKDIDIWVVRLEVKVDDETFAELKGFARELRGYYSTYKDAKGFVFKSEKEANKFGDKLDDYLQIEETDEEDYELEIPEYTDVEIETQKTVMESDTEDSNEITETEEISLDHFCTALKHLIKDKGAKIITDTIYKTVNVLKSMDAFKELPPSFEFILRIIIMKKYGQRLLDVKDFCNDYHEIVNDFSYRTGIKEDLVECVFECLAYAVGKTDELSCELVNTTTKIISSKGNIQLNEKPLNTCPYKSNIKDFYSTGKLPEQKLWCLWFNTTSNAGNADFAMFRKRTEQVAGYYVHIKLANGIGFYNKSDFYDFMKMVRD